MCGILRKYKLYFTIALLENKTKQNLKIDIYKDPEAIIYIYIY